MGFRGNWNIDAEAERYRGAGPHGKTLPRKKKRREGKITEKKKSIYVADRESGRPTSGKPRFGTFNAKKREGKRRISGGRGNREFHQARVNNISKRKGSPTAQLRSALHEKGALALGSGRISDLWGAGRHRKLNNTSKRSNQHFRKMRTVCTPWFGRYFSKI